MKSSSALPRTLANSKAPEVLRLKASGLTVLQIAHELKISPQAVYKHLNRQGVATGRKEAAV